MATFGIPIWRNSKPTAGEVLLKFKANFNFTIAPALSGSTTLDDTVPTSDAVLTILKNGSSIATAKFHHDGTVTLAGAGGSFVKGTDIFSVTAPASQDATFNNFSLNILATKTS